MMRLETLNPIFREFKKRDKIFGLIGYIFSYIDFLLVLSQTLDKQTLDTTNPRQANTRHDKP